MEFVGFDWDNGNLGKCRKHGVSIEAVESLFGSPVAILPDVPTRRRNSGCGRWDEPKRAAPSLWSSL
jgi:uncharacterized DUF497 family protein